MSSSDSEDDCYGNVAKKLQTMKNKYTEDKVEFNNTLNESTEINEIVKKAGFGANTTAATADKVDDDSFDLSEDKELEELIAASSKSVIAPSSKRVTRASKRTKNQEEKLPELPAPTKSKSDDESGETSRGRGRGRSRRGRNDSRGQNNSDSHNESRGRGRRGQATPRGRRGRGRSRGMSRNNLMSMILPMFNAVNAYYPTYSIGNTDEYPDQSESQGLFSKKPQPQSEVVVIDENDSLDDNEDLSVKVYWQNSEFFKFTIRKYQKITSIFDYFSKKENVSHDKLFFTFNDRILKPDDTPDSINYNIVKFIDGGIVNHSVSKLVTNKTENITNGIKLKFQCQNIKKPFETVIRVDDKLSVAMVKCAEYFEKTLDQLRFEFDGDSLSGKSTPQDLELEGGECIDVKILS